MNFCDRPTEPVIILGAGGFAKEAYNYAIDCGWRVECFADLHDADSIMGVPVRGMPNSATAGRDVLVAVGAPAQRRKIIESLPAGVRFPRLVHPRAYLGRDVRLGEGAIVCPNVVITTMVTIGRHAQFNLATTIGHDSVIGDYCTTAPGVHISGKVTAGHGVYFGTGCVVLEDLRITDNVTVGASACVVKALGEPGVYVGIPAKPLARPAAS
jgi:sugar O-acyltransferase (sialic acid O-acetyltransferase NeuD family)